MTKGDFRIVFMGTPQFAVASLKALYEAGFTIVGVITSPDKPAGRGQKLQQSAVKEYALEKGFFLLQPANLKDKTFHQQLNSLNADLQIIVAFRMLPESIWSMPRMGSINLHASLLPNYRGAAPINWALINGEKYTGVTTFFLKHEIDTGDIINQERIAIDTDDNAGTIHDKLMDLGAKLLIKTTDSIINSTYKEIPQDQLMGENAVHAPKIFKPDCKIDWLQPISQIHNLVRGLSPYPTAWSEFKNTEGHCLNFKIFKAQAESALHQLPIGSLITDGVTYLKVAATDGFITLHEIQISGKTRMTINEFLRGFKHITDYTVA